MVGFSNSSTVEYTHAAVTPIDTSVSIVDPPWRAAFTAPRWNGQPPQNVTGNDSTMATQPQCGNWKTVNIEIKNSGTVRMAETISRGLSSRAPGASSTAGASAASSAVVSRSD